MLENLPLAESLEVFVGDETAKRGAGNRKPARCWQGEFYHGVLSDFLFPEVRGNWKPHSSRSARQFVSTS
jgi:hypothetical protein